jgi:DMSO/TMAO reductase YedYZ molybdopterin-dependent catalytic subunit
LAADDEGPGRSDPPPVRTTRHSRRRFLVLGGSLIAGLVAAVKLGLWGAGGSRSHIPAGASSRLRSLLESFPVLHVEPVPNVPPEKWVITVDGLVDKPLTVDYATWRELARKDELVDFHCVEGWSVDNVTWGGVPPVVLLARAKVRPEGKFVTFHAYGGRYTDSLPLADATGPQTLLADTLDGEPLPADHGGPVRLVIPSQLGYKNVKWVDRLEVTAAQATGYWEQSGYPVNAPVRS